VFLRYLTLHKLGLVLLENALLMVCVLWENIQQRTSHAGFYDYAGSVGGAFVFAITFQIGLHLLDAYDFRVTHSQLDFSLRLAQGIALGCLVSWLLWSVIPALAVVPNTLPLLVRVPVFLALWHVGLRIYFRLLLRRSAVLILGTGRLARAVATEILQRPELGLSVCGFLDDDPSLLGVSIVNPKVLGLNRDVRRIVSEQPVSKIVVELQDRRGRLPIEDLLELKTSGVSVEEATCLYERLTGKIAIENLKASWMIFSEGFEVSGRTLLLKNLLSIIVSLMLLFLFFPFVPFIALLIKLDSRGPVFHRQNRVGQHGKVFSLWKFRSMETGAERETGPVWASKTDNRVTRVGKYLRRTRLDELPQLYNVLKGDMTLVGPRPERPHFVKQLAESIPYYHLRHSVKPGVTGWAQVNYRYGSSLEDAVEKLQYDLFYIKNISLLLDTLVIFDTVKTVLMRKGS
jgi:sugar transferase (PEP-CTERM system associated)